MHLFSQYTNLVLKRPFIVITGIAFLVLLALFFARNFRLDASADSLVVEGDPDLAYAREVSAKFGTSDFVFVVYTPGTELFSPVVLDDLRLLRDELQALGRVKSVDSIFNVPLFKLAGATLSDVADKIITLEDPELDLEAAQADLLANTAYRDVLLSADGKTTALIVNFSTDPEFPVVTASREEYSLKEKAGELDQQGKETLRALEGQYQELHNAAAANLHSDIESIRAILQRHETHAAIHMGGVPMIADDLITYVKKDLESFSGAILLFIIAALWIFFRDWRLVAIPLVCGAVITLINVGFLGLVDWPVTVISSNFVSLLLIITVSLTVHLIVRYQELQTESPGESHGKRLQLVLSSMFVPCLYTSLTTMVAFGSLATSSIPPVVDFGWMMMIGVFSAFLFCFLLFPALMALVPKIEPPGLAHSFDITPLIGRMTEKHRAAILIFSVLLAVASVIGLGRLKVENSFIDYFDEGTEIHQGMLAIDSSMGGTTPLDVIVDLGSPDTTGAGLGFAEDEFWEDEEAENSDAAWFTSDKMRKITQMHQYLDGLSETGKVLSLATLLEIAYELNGNRELNSFELGILYSRIPETYKETLLKPYVSVADNQVRFSIRVRESDPTLKRGALLEKISSGLAEKFALQPEQIHLSGMLVLYNNMLNSLFSSQIETISLVMAAVFCMFIVLFRSLYLAVLGIIPNILAAMSVLGLMGLLGIPLDIMTITIAAIAIGIGVDNTIHYVHRFQMNFPLFRDYLHTMHYCHSSIGKGIYYTNFTIIAGFSILVLSNFVPTVFFGLLTSLAMFLALAGALTLLPLLLVICKPLGKEGLT
jgi:predicted RND superfamily exporter protein